jgi:protein required for attachment to host cells
MASSDVFPVLLNALDDVGRVFDHDDTCRWPPGALEALKQLGLVRQATGGLHAPCPNCHEAHIEPVTIRQTPDGTPRYFIRCPESMRVEVTAEMCIGWQVDGDGLAKALCDTMDLKSKAKVIVPGRLWRLGRTPWKQATREAVFASRLYDADAASIAAHIGPGGRAIVFVPRDAPDDRIWPGHVPAVVALSRVATLTPQGIQLDVAVMSEIVTDADTLAETRSALPVDPEVKKRIVRQQIKAEIKGHLEDDVLIAAWKTYGSVRKAASVLTEKLGRTITKDMVHNALKREGGAKKLRESDDTASVARTVASQRRDRAKKVLERR